MMPVSRWTRNWKIQMLIDKRRRRLGTGHAPFRSMRIVFIRVPQARSGAAGKIDFAGCKKGDMIEHITDKILHLNHSKGTP